MGAYLQQASQKEPRLYLECLHCYIKANAVEKAQEIVREMTKAEIECDLEELNGAIAYYRSEGLCSAFKAPEWDDMINSLVYFFRLSQFGL